MSSSSQYRSGPSRECGVGLKKNKRLSVCFLNVSKCIIVPKMSMMTLIINNHSSIRHNSWWLCKPRQVSSSWWSSFSSLICKVFPDCFASLLQFQGSQNITLILSPSSLHCFYTETVSFLLALKVFLHSRFNPHIFLNAILISVPACSFMHHYLKNHK